MPISNYDLETIANYELTVGVSKHVEGMQSFLPYFLKGLPKPDLKLIQRYQKIKNSVIDKAVTDFKKE